MRNEKKLTKWRKKFKEELKEDGLDIRIYKNDEKVILKTKWERYLVSNFKIIEDGLYRRALKWSGITKELVEKTMNYWEEFGKINELKYIVFNDVSYKDETFNHIKDLGFKPVADFNVEGKIVTEHFGVGSDAFLKELEAGIVKEYLQLTNLIEKTMKTIKEEQPTFQYELEGVEVRFKKIYYYFMGHRGSIKINKKRDIYSFEEKEVGFHKSFKTIEEIETIIIELFKKLEKRQKTKNLFDPPKKYFKAIMITHYNIHNQEYQAKIFNKLRETIEPEKIEELCLNKLNQNKPSKIEVGLKNSTVIIFKLFDLLFVINKDNIFSYNATNSELAKEKYKELVINELMNKLNEDKTSLEKKLKKLNF